MTTREEVRDFILTKYYVTRPDSLFDGMSLLEAGIIDSTGVLELLAVIESEFGVRATDDEIVPENLDVIERIVAYIEHKRGRAGADSA